MTGKYVNLEQLPDGNLKISLLSGEENKAEVEYIHKENYNKWYSDISEILEYWQENANYELLPKRFYENIGALTSSPIIVQNLDIDDNGDFEKVEKVWWYPDYQVSDPIEILLKRGYVIFESGE